MVKFRDLNNDNNHLNHQSRREKKDASKDNSRLSFRKLAAQEKVNSEGKAVSETTTSEIDLADESGKVLYQKAADYLAQVLEAVKQRKPFSVDPGFQIIREMVEVQSFQDSLFIEALHFDDPLRFIINNNINVAIYAIKMAENLGWGKDLQIEIGMAGLFHDVGMVLIPEELLYKQQRLNEDELKIFKERSNYSYEILKSFGADYAYLAASAVQANERLDGSGYPLGLIGEEIHEYAQIIGLVDLYEALIHSRPQREKFHHFFAVKEIFKSSKHLFQRKYLKALLNIFSIFPIYSYVRLNSNAIGRVIETYPDLPMRPKIQIVFDSQQRRVLTKRIVNLPDDPLLYLVDSVSDEELQQLSEDSGREVGRKAETEKKVDGADSVKADAAINSDEPTVERHKKGDRTDQRQKTGRLKPFLIIAAISMLAAGLILKFINKETEPVDAGNFQTAVMEKAPESVSTKASTAYPERLQNESPGYEDLEQEKPIDSQPPESNDTGSGHEAAAAVPWPESRRSEEAVTLEKPVADVEEEPVAFVKEELVADVKEESVADIKVEPVADVKEEPIAADASIETESPEASSENGSAAESVKRLFPFSIKLEGFRTREEAEIFILAYRPKGLSPFWVKVNLGDQGIWYRIFTGYFEDNAAAREFIRTYDLKGVRIKKTKYATLIGTYQSEAELTTQSRLVSKQGFSPYVMTGADGEFYLYVGAFYTHKGAEDQYVELLASGIQSKVVER
jgi:HD-GYP domain-containing protein (c-di-GMP phosphodiesterase class II)